MVGQVGLVERIHGCISWFSGENPWLHKFVQWKESMAAPPGTKSVYCLYASLSLNVVCQISLGGTLLGEATL